MSGVFYNQAELQPPRSRYWLNAEPDEAADKKMADITQLYLQAKPLLKEGERVMSTDEMTGIQALERKHPTIGMGPGRVARGAPGIRIHPPRDADVNRQFRCGAGQNRRIFYGAPPDRRGLCGSYATDPGL